MIVSRHIATTPPYNGLPPGVLNVPAQFVGQPAVSASAGVYTTANYLTATNNNINASVAPGTQPNEARNVVVLLSPNTGSAGFYSGGSVIVYGKDYFGSTRSEAFAVTAINAASAPQVGSVNFASIESISFKSVRFHTASSSARSDASVYVGYGQKIGLPVNIVSTNAVHAVHLGSVCYLTSSGASSSNNQYAVTTGPYWNNGVAITAGLNAASVLRVGYANIGQRLAVGSY